MNIFHSHTKELQYKLIYLFLSFGMCLFISFHFSDAFYYLFVKPLLVVDPSRSFLFTDLREGFQTTLQLVFLTSFLFVSPYALYLSWTFWKPSLFNHEIGYFGFLRWSLWVILWSWITYTFVLPFLWGFFLDFEVSSGLINIYLEATLQAYFRFTFQIWACSSLFLFLPKLVENYSHARPAIWGISLAIVAFLSPPEGVVQILLTLTLWCIFEFVFLMRAIQNKYPNKINN
jgi:Sec-independent protein secretion pathway component TatC